MPSAHRRTLSCTTGVLLLGILVGCGDDGTQPVGPSAEPAGATAAAVAPLSFRQVSAGNDHTCGVTTADTAYCWGENGGGGLSGGQLGDGTTTDRLKPVAVAGGLSFRQVSAGVHHSCGVTATNMAYCWGRNDFGQLGDGTTVGRLTPVRVAGDRRFRQISAAEFHTCAVTMTDALFCWGTNEFGGMGAASSPTPVRVAGALKFRNVGSGYSHSCGATTDNRGYCWGNNTNFQIGDGTSSPSKPPTRVAGGLNFRAVFAGSGFISDIGDPAPDQAISCGITTTDRVYCWGSGAASSTPKEVEGGRRYAAIGVGNLSCGVNLAGAIYCWSLLGVERVASGTLRFRNVTSSGIGAHQCAVGTDDKAYCWGGDNSEGQLGNGTTSPSSTPIAVAAPE